MNKTIFYSIISFMVVGVTSCQNDLRPSVMTNAMISVSSPVYEDAQLSPFVVEVDTEKTIKLIESNDSFILYFGNQYCGSCEAVRPSLIEYIDKTGALVFHYDNLINANEYNLLVETYPDIFPLTPSTPTFFFFEKGDLVTLREGSVRMFEYSTFKPLMDGLVKVNDAQYTNSYSLLSNLVSSEPEYFYFYDRLDPESSNLWANTILPSLDQLNSSFIILDLVLSTLTQEDIDALDINFGFQTQSGYLALVQSNNPQILSSISLTTSTSDDILNWLLNN